MNRPIAVARGTDTSRGSAPDVASLRAIPTVLPAQLTQIDLRGEGSPWTGEAPGAAAGRATWLRAYVTGIVALDVLGLLLAAVLGQLTRFNEFGERMGGVGFGTILALGIPAWVILLAAGGTYESRHLGLGSEEYRRVTNAAARYAVLVATVNLMFKWGVARGFVIVALPASWLFTLLFRFLARKVLHRLRGEGRACHRVLVVGEGAGRATLVQRLQDASYSGLNVVGSCRPANNGSADPAAVVAHVRERVLQVGADTVAIAHSPSITPDVMRQLAWSLEGTGVNLLVAPALTDVAGPRINIRHVSGLPLLQISEPQFTGLPRVVKRVIDVIASGLLLLLLAPLLGAVALAVRLSSTGPVLFKQTRIGKDGKPFNMYKFRSMYVDAEARLEELRALNDHGDGVLFKMRNDPRITSIGKYLRRFSLDELPQFVNVLRGTMSLVGPRPPLPSEVEQYERDVHRRLLVTPGITGLWQVSGRSDLSWDESVRLDLYYVENWSVTLDIEILWKTTAAVLRGSGAR